MPTYRNMKVSAINDIVANTCLKKGKKKIRKPFNLEITEIFDGLIYPYLVVILEVSVTLYHA